MNPILHLFRRFSTSARRRRARVFIDSFDLTDATRILDLGGGDASHVHSILHGTPVQRCNVYVADIDASAVERAHGRFGFTPVPIHEGRPLPFPAGYFDIVYCSSVIEHVTVPKDTVWRVRCDREFRSCSLARQRQFANEIARLGRQYFVQTPNRHFPLESHSWLPFAGYLPRRALVPLLRLTNRFWVKKTSPDWHLLDRRVLAELFPDARIVEERLCGMTKSLMAIRSECLPHDTAARTGHRIDAAESARANARATQAS